jgi:hypothetical protein
MDALTMCVIALTGWLEGWEGEEIEKTEERSS